MKEENPKIGILEMGESQKTSVTLDEILSYLGKADKICLVAID